MEFEESNGHDRNNKKNKNGSQNMINQHHDYPSKRPKLPNLPYSNSIPMERHSSDSQLISEKKYNNHVSNNSDDSIDSSFEISKKDILILKKIAEGQTSVIFMGELLKDIPGSIVVGKGKSRRPISIKSYKRK